MFKWRNSQNNDVEDDSVDYEEKVKELKVALGPLSGRDKTFCNDGCLRRYLVARSWNVDNAKKMLEDTLKWRASYKPEDIRWHEVTHEGETGKISRADFHDREGRTVLIMRPGKQNTTSPEGNIRHLVYMLENAILNLPEGQHQMCWLIDFTDFSMTKNSSVGTTREIINIFQNHYPERLGFQFLYNPPRIFQAFWNVVKYFLDPKTFEKVKFVYPNNKESLELMTIYFDIENLPKEFGGNATLEYDHDEFSKLMRDDDAKTSKLWGSDA
ncbi:hypothetical protein RND81_02G139200 [Saponaria officinalis]|uniref:CRAL-TRIO domain-containing protein n=1 Tax=Saponaria officinalis TaxID=3572 RepID=A0AAW1MSX8_SAPOF